MKRRRWCKCAKTEYSKAQKRERRRGSEKGKERQRDVKNPK